MGTLGEITGAASRLPASARTGLSRRSGSFSVIATIWAPIADSGRAHLAATAEEGGMAKVSTGAPVGGSAAKPADISGRS
jgi:hypothetical protein